MRGSEEAIVGSVGKYSGDEVSVKVLHTGVGAISESDVTLAKASGAMIVAFNVRAQAKAKELAQREKINVRYYSVIYDVVDDVKAAIGGLLWMTSAPGRTKEAARRRALIWPAPAGVAVLLVALSVLRIWQVLGPQAFAVLG